MQVERRRKRSSYTTLSLHYWLSSVAARSQALAFVLADPAGLLVAASVRGPEAEELAAVAPLFARNVDEEVDLMEWDRLPVAVDTLEVGGADLLLCALGEGADGAGALGQAAQGVLRILTN